MQKINWHPEIIGVKNFLTKHECQFYIAESERKGFKEAKISRHGKQVMMKNVRNNDRVLFFDEKLANQIWEKIKPFTNSIGMYKPIGLNEMFRVYKYTKGQRFNMHRDGSYRRNDEEVSFYSFLIYLNEDFDGGETYFENGIYIKPHTGDALLFHHPLRHEGQEITKGVKYVLRTDIMFRRI